ncbi:MAG: tetratricopeptide repeat protein, partial [Verrucomicrobiae bacterium]|nr:tetratricopeptide repeat protein [Verrucomicrobiae bacterium]
LKNYTIPDTASELVDFLAAKADYAIASAAAGSLNSAAIVSATENFRRAEAAFRKTTNGADPQTAAVALYDAAISALRADARENLDAYLSALDENPGLKGNLLIERGLYLAANQHFRDAQASLEAFIEFSPNHPRAFAAHLALAEIAIRKLPEPDVRTASRHLELAQSQSGLTDYQNQQLDYTRFWLEISQRSEEPTKMVTLGNRFLTDWPTESPWRDDVLMKLGEHYYKTENYPLAISMFETLETESPDSDLAEPALYFAGKANMRLDPTEGPKRAFALWNRVVAKGGPLSISARYQQALVKRRQLEHDDAAEILRSLLGSDKVAGEERKAILCSLGETLFSQSAKDPDKLPEAEKIFLEAAGGPEDSPSWRNQSLYRLAKCYERAGNPQGAKDAYFKVFDTAAVPVPDYTWFYRAGSQLFELLKAEKNWDAAIAIATKLADAQGSGQGPRAKEFAQKAERLKLEYYRR